MDTLGNHALNKSGYVLGLIIRLEKKNNRKAKAGRAAYADRKSEEL
jgi:hypothetical protein